MKHQTTVKIPFHSMIDLITNSSTEIFVDSENSIEPAKAVMAELLKLNHSLKTVDEIFTFTVEEDLEVLADVLSEHLGDYDEETYNELGLEKANYKESYDICEKYAKDIQDGKIEKPDYLDDMLNDNEYNIDSKLVITSNDPKYDHFLILLETFLYSPEYQEGYS